MVQESAVRRTDGRDEHPTSCRSGKEEAGSRRHVTVLFCDLVGSTQIAEQLDPEAVHEILLAYHRSAAEVIEGYGGSVGKFMGDGVLACFGHPRAHEDDARRAVLAGLDLVSRVSELSAWVKAAHGLDLAVRVGIHTGLVVVAATGAGDRQEREDIIGANTNVTYRIQQEAEPQTVLISGATNDLVSGYFVVSEVGARPLKGISQPVDLYRVVTPSGAESRLEAIPRRAPMVGRETERTALLEAWQRTCAGRGETIFVEGEPGIGKSRLVECLKENVRESEGVCVTLQCSPYHVNTVLFPVARLLRQHVRPDQDDADAAWCRLRELVEASGPAPDDDLYLLATFADVPFPADVRVPVLTAERRLEQLIQALIRWVDRTTAVAPVLVVVEDLHWTDPSTLEFVERLAGRASPGRLLIVVTSRPGHEFKADVSALWLDPLEREERETLVAHLQGDAPIAPPLRDQIVERSDGIPLFVEELTRMFAGGDLVSDLPRAPMSSLEIPMTLQDLLAARLDQFPNEKHLAQVVATAGPGAPLALLAELLSADEHEVLDALEPLVAARLVSIEGASCSFRHALLRDAAYQSQLRSKARELHRRVAEVLVDRFGHVCATQPELLAEHWFQSGEHARAAESWYRAGQRMALQGAHREASAYYRSALSALRAAPASDDTGPMELSLQSSLGVSLTALEGYTSPQAERAYARAMELTAQMEGPPDATTHFGLWSYWVVRGDHRKAVMLARESLAAAEASGSRAGVLHASCLLGYSEFYVGHLDEARALLEVGSTYDLSAEEIELPHHPAVASLVNLAPTLWILGRPEEARRALSEGLEGARTLGAPWGPFTRAYAHTFAAWFYELADDPANALTHATRAVEISGEYGFPTWLGAGTLHLGIAQAMAGMALESIVIIDPALDMWRTAGAELFVTYYLYALAAARRAAGDLEGARRHVDEALVGVEQRGERFYEAELLRLRGELIVEEAPHRGEQGIASLWQAVEVARRQGARTFELRAVTSVHRAAAEAGCDLGTASLLETTLLSFADDLEMPDIDRARATLAAVRT